MPLLEELFITLGIKDNKFTATMRRGAESVDVLTKELADLNKAARKTGNTAAGASKGVRQFQQSILSSEITAAAFAFTLQRVLSNALNAFVEFEQGIIDVTKVINQIGREDVPALEQSIISLTQTLPLTRAEILGIGRSLGQLGFFAKTANNEIVDAFEGTVGLVGRLSVATDLSAEQAAQSLGVLRNVFLANVTSTKEATAQLSAYGDVANEISNTTAATATDIFRFNAAIGATATQAGLSFNQVSGFAAAIRQLGISVDVGATALQRFFGLAITRAEVFADAIGVTEAQFRELFERDPNDALLRFFKALNEATTQRQAQILQGISAEQRLVRVLNGIAGNLDLVTRSQQTATQASKDGTSVLEEFGKVTRSTQASLVRFGNTIGNALVQGFATVAPVVNAVLDAVTLLGQTVPSLTAGFGALVIVGGAVTAALLSLSIIVPRVAQGYQILTTALRLKNVEQAKGTATEEASIPVTSAVTAANDRLAVSLTRAAAAQTQKNAAQAQDITTSKGRLASLKTFGRVAAFAIGVTVVTAATAAIGRIRQVGEQLAALEDASPEKAVKALRDMAEQASFTENTLTGLFNVFANGEFKTLSEELEDQAGVIENAARRLERQFKRALAPGLEEGATRAQVARTELLQKAYDKLGDRVGALGVVNVNTEENIRRLRAEYGATEEQLLALASAVDEAGGSLVAVGGGNFDSFTDQVRAVLGAIRREQEDINEEQRLSEELTDVITQARQREERAAKEVLSTLREINEERKVELENEGEREERLVSIKLAVEQRRGDLESLINRAVEQAQDVAATAGSEILVDLNFDTGAVTADTSELTIETRKEVENILAATRLWLSDLIDIDDAYAGAKQIIAETETAQQKLARESQEALQDNTLAIQKERAERENNFEALKSLERRAVEVKLQRLAVEQEAEAQSVETERAFQARRTAILQNYASRRLDIAREEADARKEANEELQRIIDSRARANITTDLQEQQVRLQDLRALSNAIVNGVADEEVKREALKAVMEETSQIAAFGLESELDIRRRLVTLEEERADEVAKRIREEQVAADNAFNETRRAANLNTRAGRRAVAAAEVERDLRKQIAEIEQDGIVTASEIDQIEQKRLEAAQRVAELTGQTRQAAGRDQLQNDLERIRDEARAQRAALEDVAGLDEPAIVDSGTENELARQQELQGELNGILETRNALSEQAKQSIADQTALYERLGQAVAAVAAEERQRGTTDIASPTDLPAAESPLTAAAGAPVGSGILDIDVHSDHILGTLNGIEEAVESVNTAFDASAGNVNVAAQGVQTAASNFEATLSPTLRNMTKALEATRGAFENITETVESIDERVSTIEQIFSRASD